MRQTIILILCAAALLVAVSACKSDPEKALRKQVNAIYDRLSLEEKAAQLYGIYPGDLLVDGKVSLEKCREIIDETKQMQQWIIQKLTK